MEHHDIPAVDAAGHTPGRRRLLCLYNLLPGKEGANKAGNAAGAKAWHAAWSRKAGHGAWNPETWHGTAGNAAGAKAIDTADESPDAKKSPGAPAKKKRSFPGIR